MLVSAGVPEPSFTPLVRARMTHINGVPADEYPAATPRGRDELDDETNLTWSAAIPPDNDVVSGEWWSDGDETPDLARGGAARGHRPEAWR